MKKLITILCLVFGLGVILSPIANAEETVEDTTVETPNEEVEDEPVEEEFIQSDLGEYFKEEIEPYLVEVVTTLIGFAVSCLIFMLKNKKQISILNTNSDTRMNNISNKVEKELKVTQNLNEKLIEQLETFKALWIEEKAEMQKEMEALKIKNEQLIKDNQKIAVISEDLNKLKNSFRIIAVNDAKLVANGQAKYIAKELETNGETKDI